MKTQMVYIADDGTQFTDQQTCLDYEKSQPLRDVIESYLRCLSMEEEWDIGPIAKNLSARLMKHFLIAKRIPNGQQTSPNSNDNR